MLLETSELVAYYAGPLGHMTRRFISARLEAIAQDLSSIEGGTVVGHGFATPFLDRFSAAQHMAAVMPESQGAERWPRGAPSRVVLAENNRIPLADESVDVLLAVHSLESALDPRTQLREFWRVLKGEGHLIVVVPNRRGVWARFDTTPFGSGQPYSAGQLERLLRSVFFSPVAMDAALFAPPATSSHLLRVAPVVEKIGRTGLPLFAGVVIATARKELEAPLDGGLGATVAAPERVLEEALPSPAMPYTTDDEADRTPPTSGT